MDVALCAINGCSKPKYTRGMCAAHYRRWRLYGDASILKRPAPVLDRPSTCVVPGCGKPHQSLGYCSAHYTRLRRNGDVDTRLRAANGETLKWIAEHANYGADDCIEWPYARGGRGDSVVFYDGGMRSASRIMCLSAHGEPPEPSYEAAHSCGKGHEGCMNPRHLSWKTTAENHADKLLHGTDDRGEKSSTSVLLEREVLRILLEGERPLALSRELGVSVSLIHAIRKGQKWPHIFARVSAEREVA